ncbi:MAG: BamA/TamA family outer membrane protein [Bacteroidota bacterium]
MRKQQSGYIITIVSRYVLPSLLMMLCACNNIKRLPENENLYTGAVIKVTSKDKVNKRSIRTELEKIPRPNPNSKLLGLRLKLSIYNYTGDAPKKKFKKMLRRKYAEKPVLQSKVNPANISDIMINHLNSLGYFDANVTYTVVTKKRKTHVEYTATVTAPYTISKFTFPTGEDLVSRAVKESEKETLIKTDIQYSLDLLKAERERIDYYMKNNGFYYFNQDYLIFKGDTTIGKKTIHLNLNVKKDIPEKSKIPYRINNVYINPSYSLKSDSIEIKADTIKTDGYYYLNKDSTLHPSAVTRSVFIKKGDYYTRKNYSLTINRLMGMGVFRNVTVKFTDTIINGVGFMDAYINLTPSKKKSLQVELETVTKSNNYTGPALTLSFKNRNLLKGAELFLFNLNGNFETQFSKLQSGFNSYEFGANTQLYIPKFVAPFTIRNVSSTYVPKTKIDLGFRLLNRVLYFKMAAVNASFGYVWKESAQKEYEVTPLSINFAKLLSTTSAFETLLIDNPFLRKSFEEQFTLGGKYGFTYNSLVGNQRRNQYYFNAILDLSGNTITAIESIIKGRKPTENDHFFLLGYRYSQYSKLSTDTRYYLTLNKNNKIAARLLAGAGIPYGNSNSMPYIKQFFSGGSNSIRAFLPRTIGPGSYIIPDSLANKGYLDQAGDIKLEANFEYRFTIVSVLKGAIFIDAGNVWLSRKNALIQNGEFDPNRFYKEIAVGTGIGLRADISFFVIRFDLGMPLRKPSLPENERWVYDKLYFGDGKWRKQNLVLNIAIGYPF